MSNLLLWVISYGNPPRPKLQGDIVGKGATSGVE